MTLSQSLFFLLALCFLEILLTEWNSIYGVVFCPLSLITATFDLRLLILPLLLISLHIFYLGLREQKLLRLTEERERKRRLRALQEMAHQQYLRQCVRSL